jgi:hypothetical protein
MRRAAAIVIAAVVAASCIPWLRHQHLFSVFVGITAIVLSLVMVFAGLRAFANWSRKAAQQVGPGQSAWLSSKLFTRLSAAVVVLLSILIISQFVATHTDAYRLAVTTARQSPQFTEELGAPIEEGWFSADKWEFGNPVTAELTIPVKGSKRKGSLRARAVKEESRWRLTELALELTGPSEHIDLLSR